MKEVNKLGLRVAGLTTLVLLALFGVYMGGKWLIDRFSGEGTKDDEVLTAEDRQRDSDGDGVADLYETVYYGTNPNSRDTDSDGMGDLDEILAGRNPTIADQDATKPPTGEAVVEQNTFTQKYLATLPTDISREEILEEARLAAFVEANKNPVLPELVPDRVKLGQVAGATAVSDYLDQTSASHNPAIKAVTSTDLEVAFREQATAGNVEQMQNIILALQNNLVELDKVTAPVETGELHGKQIAATEGLLNSARLLQTVDTDFVGSLIGAKRIEDLGVVFQEIAAEVAALEAKYNLE